MRNCKEVVNVKNWSSLLVSRKIEILNLCLLAFCAFLIVFYIIQINQIVSKEYSMDMLRNDLSEALAQQNRLISQKADSDGIPIIARFATKSGMVEALNINYIFEDSSFARR